MIDRVAAVDAVVDIAMVGNLRMLLLNGTVPGGGWFMFSVQMSWCDGADVGEPQSHAHRFSLHGHIPLLDVRIPGIGIERAELWLPMAPSPGESSRELEHGTPLVMLLVKLSSRCTDRRCPTV
jgi:hypothetical protein